MIRISTITLAACLTLFAQGPGHLRGASAPSLVAVARRFLPPACRLASLITFNYRTMQYGTDFPAVLSARILSPTSHDIVFAYYSPVSGRDTIDKTLFITLIHRAHARYEKVCELSYRSQVLLVPNAIRIVHLRGLRTDAVGVIAGIGADLGGRLQIFVWRDPWAWENIFPPNGSMHYFYFFRRPDGLDVVLSAARHPGLNVSPPLIWFHWNGKEFAKIPPPPGSSKWPLPD